MCDLQWVYNLFGLYSSNLQIVWGQWQNQTKDRNADIVLPSLLCENAKESILSYLVTNNGPYTSWEFEIL